MAVGEAKKVARQNSARSFRKVSTIDMLLMTSGLDLTYWPVARAARGAFDSTKAKVQLQPSVQTGPSSLKASSFWNRRIVYLTILKIEGSVASLALLDSRAAIAQEGEPIRRLEE